jgi:tetratricopeptide (TPR) repeat protein
LDRNVTLFRNFFKELLGRKRGVLKLAKFYNVVFPTDNGFGQKGWIKASDVSFDYEKQIELKNLMSKGNKFLSKAREANSVEKNPEPYLEQAEGIFKKLLNEYAEEIFIKYNDTKLHVGVAALNGLSKVYIERKEYTTAIKMLEQIIEKFPDVLSGIGIASGVAKQDIAQIYWKKLHNPQKSIAIYQQIIEEYPNRIISGFEWSTTLDNFSINNIKKIGEEDSLRNDYMLSQYDIAIENSNSDAVKVISTIEKAKIFRREGKWEKAIDELISIINRYPTAQVQTPPSKMHYSISALDLLCEIYVDDLHDPTKAIEVCQNIIAKNLDEDLTKGADVLRFKILDETNGAKDYILEQYKNFGEKYHNWRVYSSIRKHGEQYIASGFVKNRIKQINSFKTQTGLIKENTLLYQKDNFNSKIISNLTKGMEIKILYDCLTDGKTWYKIETESGNIGWLSEEQIDLNLEAPNE